MTRDDLLNYRVTERLRNGIEVTIRTIRPEDKTLLLRAFKELEESSVYTRFFAPKKGLTDQELKWATEIDFVRHVALVACIGGDGEETIIGGCRYVASAGSGPPSSAEIAFLVEEDYHGLGLASILLRHLVLIGRAQGISRFEAEVLPSNRAMLRVFSRAGLHTSAVSSGDVVNVAIFLNQGEKE